MAKFVFNNPYVTINSVALADHIAQVTLDMSYDAVETTAFGSTDKTRIAGLGDHKVTVSFHQDYAASNVEATIYPLLGSTTTIVLKPVTAANSTTNPQYTIVALVNEWRPVGGQIGNLATADVTWPISGGVTKTTA